MSVPLPTGATTGHPSLRPPLVTNTRGWQPCTPVGTPALPTQASRSQPILTSAVGGRTPVRAPHTRKRPAAKSSAPFYYTIITALVTVLTRTALATQSQPTSRHPQPPPIAEVCWTTIYTPPHTHADSLPLRRARARRTSAPPTTVTAVSKRSAEGSRLSMHRLFRTLAGACAAAATGSPPPSCARQDQWPARPRTAPAEPPPSRTVSGQGGCVREDPKISESQRRLSAALFERLANADKGAAAGDLRGALASTLDTASANDAHALETSGLDRLTVAVFSGEGLHDLFNRPHAAAMLGGASAEPLSKRWGKLTGTAVAIGEAVMGLQDPNTAFTFFPAAKSMALLGLGREVREQVGTLEFSFGGSLPPLLARTRVLPAMTDSLAPRGLTAQFMNWTTFATPRNPRTSFGAETTVWLGVTSTSAGAPMSAADALRAGEAAAKRTALDLRTIKWHPPAPAPAPEPLEPSAAAAMPAQAARRKAAEVPRARPPQPTAEAVREAMGLMRVSFCPQQAAGSACACGAGAQEFFHRSTSEGRCAAPEGDGRSARAALPLPLTPPDHTTSQQPDPTAPCHRARGRSRSRTAPSSGSPAPCATMCSPSCTSRTRPCSPPMSPWRSLSRPSAPATPTTPAGPTGRTAVGRRGAATGSLGSAALAWPSTRTMSTCDAVDATTPGGAQLRRDRVTSPITVFQTTYLLIKRKSPQQRATTVAAHAARIVPARHPKADRRATHSCAVPLTWRLPATPPTPATPLGSESRPAILRLTAYTLALVWLWRETRRKPDPTTGPHPRPRRPITTCAGGLMGRPNPHLAGCGWTKARRALRRPTRPTAPHAPRQSPQLTTVIALLAAGTIAICLFALLAAWTMTMGRPTPRRAGNGWRKTRSASVHRTGPRWSRPRPLRHGHRKAWTLPHLRARAMARDRLPPRPNRRPPGAGQGGDDHRPNGPTTRPASVTSESPIPPAAPALTLPPAPRPVTQIQIRVEGRRTIMADLWPSDHISELYRAVCNQTGWPPHVYRLTSSTGKPVPPSDSGDEHTVARSKLAEMGTLWAVHRLRGGARTAAGATDAAAGPSSAATTLRIASGNAGGLVKPERLAAAQHLIDKRKYDIVLLQETNLINAKAVPDLMGPAFDVYHDPTPFSSGRGVAIAVRRTCGARLENIVKGSSLPGAAGRAAAGRLLTGDLVFATTQGRTQRLELTTFHVPCAGNANGDREPFLAALTDHLAAGSVSAASPSRQGVLRIVAGDGNGTWAEGEKINKAATGSTAAATGPSHQNPCPIQGPDFKEHMERIHDLKNQVPPGSFDPGTHYTHAQKKSTSRLDYIFSNADISQHVSHTDPVRDHVTIPAGTNAENSAHFWLEANLPLDGAQLGGLIKLPDLIPFKPHRLKLNLSNKADLKAHLDEATPAYIRWHQSLPNAVRSAYLAEGVVTADSPPALMQNLLHHFSAAYEQLARLTGPVLQTALGQPDEGYVYGRPGRRAKNPIAKAAGPDKQAATWYQKAALAARRIHQVRLAHQVAAQADPARRGPLLTQREAQKLDKVLLDYHYTIRRALLKIPAESPTSALGGGLPPCLPAEHRARVRNVGAPPAGGASCTGSRVDVATLLHTLSASDLFHWIRQLEIRQRAHQKAYAKIHRDAAAAADEAKQAKISAELWRNGTSKARDLLMYKRMYQPGLAAIRHPTTDALATSPADLQEAAALHTEQLLGTAPPAPPTNQPWQAAHLWTTAQQGWTAQHAAAATRLATPADILSLINAAKASSAPGLDGIQYAALKLLLKADDQARELQQAPPPNAPPGTGAPLLHLLTNLTNAVLCAPALPAELGRSEMVYFFKSGDPTRLGNYRGIALQSVLYKLAAAFVARQTLKAAELLSLISPAQVAARKHGRAADHVATMVNALAHAHRSGQELHVITSDIQKAFDEVPREALWEALRLHGYPPELIRRARLLQTCTGVTVRTQYGRSSTPVLTKKGCKQGCPLSPVTYCLFMNMFLKALDADPSCAAYAPTDAGAPSPSPAQPGLSCQAYMDDLALFSPTQRHAQGQLDCLVNFLAAYGMALNTAKCRHTAVNADGGLAPVPQRPHLTVRRAQPAGQPVVQSDIPMTAQSGTFAYLGHHVSPVGDWSVQEGALTSKLGAAVQQVKLAAGNKACHTLWTAALTESDAASVLPYYMAATGLSQSFMKKARSLLAEPCRKRANIGEHVSRLAFFGPPSAKGLGLTSPQAAEAGIKVSTLVRLLNDESATTGELAAGPLRAMRAHRAEPAPTPQAPPSGGKRAGRPKGPALKHIPALHSTAAVALATHSRAEGALALLENYKDLGRTSMALLCPLLYSASRPGSKLPKPLAALAQLTAAEALLLAAQSAPGATLSLAERAILAGPASQAMAALRAQLISLHARAAAPTASAPDFDAVLAALFTATALQGLGRARGLVPARQQALALGLTTSLLAELCGPDAYMFVTRHADAYLQAKYPPPTQVAPYLYSPQVGVDGSLMEAARGQPAKGAGAAAFLTATSGGDADGAPVLTAHIVTSLYSGEQSVANSEYAGLTTALQTLSHSPILQIGCDHLNAVRLLHTRLPETTPAPGSSLAAPTPARQGNEGASTAEADPHTHLCSAEHYAGNPHMALAHALVARDLATKTRVRTVYKVAAHASQASDAAIAALLDEGAVWDGGAREFVVPDRVIQAVLRVAEGALKAAAVARPPDGGNGGSAAAPPSDVPPEHVRSTALNALADWGAKQVALKGATPSVSLPPCTLSAGKWCLAGYAGGTAVVQQSDPTTARKRITRRVELANLESKFHPDGAAPAPTRLNHASLWVEESAAVLTLPRRSAAAGARTAMPDEKLTKHYCHMAYGSTLYNADALLVPRNRALATTCVKGPADQAIPFSTHCPLCLPLRAAAGRPPADDTRHHLFHECEAPAVVASREALRAELGTKIRKASLGTMGPQDAAQTADLIMRRDDYFAGQIDSAARDRIETAMRSGGATGAAAPGGAPMAAGPGDRRALTPAPNGALQRAVLKHSLLIHNIRHEAIPDHLRLQRYRLAMWADERRAATRRRHVREQANKAAAALAASGLGAGPSGPTTAAAATAPDDDEPAGNDDDDDGGDDDDDDDDSGGR